MEKERSAIKEQIHEIIFEADTRAGKFFDIVLLVVIILSIITVMFESVNSISAEYGQLLLVLEWVFTILFTIEYGLRLYSVYKPWSYAKSFFGIIDLLAILPTYLSLFVAGTQYLMVIRALRLLRVFRIFKLVSFLRQGSQVLKALKLSLPKITVFLFFVILLTTILGSIMYLVESDPAAGFDSIPRSVYWAIVTLTTVGYGDIHPITPIGQFIAAIVMILGYSIIAVPTGIVTSELIYNKPVALNTQSCRHCAKEGHEDDAIFCKFCGEELNPKANME